MWLNCMLDDELFSKITQQSLSCIRIRKQWILCRVGRYLRMRSSHQFQLFFPLPLSLSISLLCRQWMLCSRSHASREEVGDGADSGICSHERQRQPVAPRVRQITEVPSVEVAADAEFLGHSLRNATDWGYSTYIPRMFPPRPPAYSTAVSDGVQSPGPTADRHCFQVHALLLQPLS